MKTISKKEFPKYFLIAIFLVLIILAFFVIKDLILSILGAIILAYFCYPVYKKLNSLIKSRTLCSLIVIILLLLVITLPLFFIVKALIFESTQVYNYVNSLNIISDPTVNDIVQKGFLFITQIASTFVLSIPKRVISLLVMFFLLFYLLKDGERFVDTLKKRIPLGIKRKTLLFNELRTVTSGVGYGIILTGILEGVIASIGFYLFGVKSYILWGFIIVILAILPAVGASIVWLPAFIIKFVNGETLNAVGILIVGIIISGYFDMILKPKLIGDKTKVHPVIIILGVIGGLKFLGIVGVVFGPLILTTLLTLFNFVCKNEIKN